MAFFSQAVISALPPESAAICVVLPPGAAAMSRMVSPGWGFISSGGIMEDRLCRYTSPRP